MRIPRFIQLHEDSGYIHKFWRCHNKEFYLSDNKTKDLYLNCTRQALKDLPDPNAVQIHAFCVMDNGAQNLSNYMRKSHSEFGRKYNKLHKRSGKVAEGRPKTPLIEDSAHLARVHFYVEANPIRAGKMNLERLKTYEYSSYPFYAYGKKGKHTDLLTKPDWYLELGKTPKAQQREYRKLFREYLEDNKIGFKNYLKAFIGSPIWELNQNRRAIAEATNEINRHRDFTNSS